jgi:hypothetical protein
MAGIAKELASREDGWDHDASVAANDCARGGGLGNVLREAQCQPEAAIAGLRHVAAVGMPVRVPTKLAVPADRDLDATRERSDGDALAVRPKAHGPGVVGDRQVRGFGTGYLLALGFTPPSGGRGPRRTAEDVAEKLRGQRCGGSQGTVERSVQVHGPASFWMLPGVLGGRVERFGDERSDRQQSSSLVLVDQKLDFYRAF